MGAEPETPPPPVSGGAATCRGVGSPRLRTVKLVNAPPAPAQPSHPPPQNLPPRPHFALLPFLWLCDIMKVLPISLLTFT